MKRIIAWASLLLGIASCIQAQTLVRIGASPSSNARIRAYIVAAYVRIGCTAELVEVPAERGRVMLETGKLEALMFERLEVIATLRTALPVGMPGKPLFTHRTFAYIRTDDSAKYRSLADLKGEKTGYIRGLRMEGFVQALGGIPFEAENVSGAVRMLMSRRFDVLIAAENSLTEPIETEGFKGNVTKMAEPVFEAAYYHVLSASLATLKQALSQEFMRTRSVLEDILGD